MAEAENKTQSLWALENGIAKSMKVYVKDPKHVAVDSFRQILFWCTEINGKVQLRWQAFNRTGKKPDCFQRQVFGATKCNGLAVSEVQTKVFILSQDTIYHATYEKLHTERHIYNRIYKFRSITSVRTIKGFSYHSGNIIWFNPYFVFPNVTILQAFDHDNDKARKPSRVIPIGGEVTQIQVLLPHTEVVKSTDQCEGFSFNFADICDYLSTDGSNPPAASILRMDPRVEPEIPESTSPESEFLSFIPVREAGTTSNTTKEQYSWWPYAAGGATLIAIIIIANILACRRLKSQTEIHAQQSAVDTFVSGNEELARKSNSEAQRALHLPFRSIIPPTSLQLSNSALGEGNFGIVHRGRFDGREVAVKTVKNSHDCNVIQDFLKELKIMAYVGLHENIIEFFGAEISQARNGLVHVVLELCPYGSLESFVRKFHVVGTMLTSGYENIEPISDSSERAKAKPKKTATYQNVISPAQPTSISLNQLMKWSRQIACGMNYLEHKNIVHGDLATRNVLVCQDLTIKISDFGFSRNMYQSDIYRKKRGCQLPWRWASPETLSRLEFSFKADVWSYGVTVWEIFSLGALPFPGLSWDDEFLKKIEQGLRPPEPQHMPLELYESVLVSCWNLVPGNRPSFEELEQRFSPQPVENV